MNVDNLVSKYKSKSFINNTWEYGSGTLVVSFF